MTKNEKDKDRVRTRRQNSGAFNRKVKQKRIAMKQSQRGSLGKYFGKIGDKSNNESDGVENNESTSENPIGEKVVDEDVNAGDDIAPNENLMDSVEINSDEYVVGPSLNLEKDVDVNYDPGLWGTINEVKGRMLVTRGPIKITKINDEFPRDAKGASFSIKNYISHQPNGENYERKWLVYSNELDKVFCFCCMLFKHKAMQSFLTESGISDWHNLPAKLRDDENNPEHNVNIVKWVDLQNGLKLKATIDKKLQSQIELEKIRWRDVLARIIGVVKRISQNCLPFRGSKEKIYEKNNGLFCQLIELLAEFDPVLKEHVRRVVDDKIQNHYFSQKIQNELIGLLANAIKQKILGKISKAKYFSIILYCTPNLSHKEQMSIIIICVDIENENKVKVEEFFLGFIKVGDTSGLGLFNRLEDTLVDLKLDIDDIRGQGYDNGSNMKGKNQGVQKRLLEINPKALYIPCGCHSLNLALCDTVKSCQKARDFFGYVQKMYTLFSGSTHRWDILTENVELMVKALSLTRWESHISSIRAIRYQAPDIRDALIELTNIAKDDTSRAEAKGLCKNTLENFEFLISLCIWFKILDKINLVSKALQKEEMDMEDGIKKIKGLIVFFENFRENGFEDLMEEANELADQIGIDPTFPQKRVVRRAKQFDDEIEDDGETSLTSRKKFRVTYFLHLIDQVLSSFKERIETFGVFEEVFGFLFIAKLRNISGDDLSEHCVKLENFLSHNEIGDINGKALFGELNNLKDLLPKEVLKSVDILGFIRSYNEDGGFRNV